MTTRDGTRAVAHRLLRRAEADAERVAAIARVVVAAVFLVLIQGIALDTLDGGIADDETTAAQIGAARLFLVALLVVGIGSYAAVRKGWGGRFRPYIVVTLDAALILGNLAHSLRLSGLPGTLFPAMPIMWVIPIVLAALVITYNVRLQLFAGLVYITGIFVIWFSLGDTTIPDRALALARIPTLFGPPADTVRVVALASMVGILILAAWRGRVLLNSAIGDAVKRAELTRFLPAEIAPLLGSSAGADLRAGRRQVATIMFVDIRNSVGYAEELDPARLSIFIASFRRRVSRAAATHGGVIDKFIGDGALVVFGLPEPRPDDAARALACAQDILAYIARWNQRRSFQPPLRIGIGVHTGEVYCGLIGDAQRIEFTVLGDTVNVAARIEDACKVHDIPLLASRDTVEAAGGPGAWELLPSGAVRGRAAPVALMKPA